MDRMHAVDIGQVKVGGEIGRRIGLTLRENLLALDVDNDFLRPFRHRRTRAEIDAWDRYTGLGLLLDAAVLLAGHTGDSEDRRRKDYLVQETLKTQSPSGYVGAFEEEPDGTQLWAEYCFHDAAHLVIGLVHDFQRYGERSSLDGARALADYLVGHWPRHPTQAVFTTEGVEEAMIDLYSVTGHRRYLQFAAEEKTGRPGRIFVDSLNRWEQPLYTIRPLDPSRYGLTEAALEPLRTASKDARLEGPLRDICHMYRLTARSMMQLRGCFTSLRHVLEWRYETQKIPQRPD